jgi:hypothetical protein
LASAVSIFFRSFLVFGSTETNMRRGMKFIRPPSVLLD